MSLTREIRHILNNLRGEAIVGGIRLPLDRRVLSRRMRRRLAGAKYEMQEVQASAAIVRPGDVILELGAGLGFVSSYLRKHTPAGAIVCVEANPDLIPYIERVHALNGIADATVLHGVALPGNAGGTLPFYCRKDFWASSLDPGSAYERAVDVNVLPFKELIATYQPSLLIVDIEGGELDLLTIDTMDGVRAVVLETHAKAYGADGLETVKSHLARLSFRPTSEHDEGKVLVYSR